jgi:polar amino acid transport system permease protein
LDVDAARDRQAVRRSARRARTRRDGLTASVTTVVLVGALVVAVVLAPGWTSVRESFLSWDDFSRSFPDILSGFWLDVRMFLITEPIILVLGLAIAVLRVTRAPILFPLRLASIVYTDVFRGVPTILVIFGVGFGIPALQFGWLTNDEVILGCAALTLSYSAYVAEVFRAGIISVHPSQRAAARALGLTAGQTTRFVVLPQAIRRVVPPLLNDFISLQKDVALVSILGPVEAYRQAQIYGDQYFNYTPLLGAAALYLCVTIPLTRITDRLQARQQQRRSTGGAA